MHFLCIIFLLATSTVEGKEPSQFHVWATSCSHVTADIQHGRESLAKAIRQSEGVEPNAPAFNWDIMIDAGDLTAHQTPPGDRDGRELIRQYHAMVKHRREQVYNVPGNHDAPYYDLGPGSWFRKWGDPLGENTLYSGVDPKRRPFPVVGNWERYRFQAGNILFLMLADRNDAPMPVGRGNSSQHKSGGYPAGAVTRDTFNWWKQQVLENQDKIIITMHHHMLRDTTTASGYGEGNPRYHGGSGGAKGSSYLYYIIEKDDPNDFRFTVNAHVFEDFLDEFNRKHGRGAIDFWIGGHTHVKGPDDDFGGKTISERKWGVTFLQVAALTKYHGGSHSLSRLLSFTNGSDHARIQTYLHEASYRNNPVGFYAPAERSFPLRHPFLAPPPIIPMTPFPESTRIISEPYVRKGKKSSSSRARDRRIQKTGPFPDLTARWNAKNGGSLHIEAILLSDRENKIDHKPTLVGTTPFGRGYATKFDGRQHLRLGPINIENWSNLSVSAWINTSHNSSNMRIVSKDSIGAHGNFILWRRGSGDWSMQAWDDQANKWRVATWRNNSLDDGQWHLLVGIVSSEQRKVILYVDGVKKAEAPWTAKTLDDINNNDLVVGSDSGEDGFGQTYQGLIHDVRLYPYALHSRQVRAIFENR